MKAGVQGDKEAEGFALLHELGCPRLNDPLGEGLCLELELREDPWPNADLLGSALFRPCDPALLNHEVKHKPGSPVSPFFRCVFQWVEPSWRLHHSGQQSGLVEV